MYIYTYIYTYIYMYMYILMHVCICKLTFVHGVYPRPSGTAASGTLQRAGSASALLLAPCEQGTGMPREVLGSLKRAP